VSVAFDLASLRPRLISSSPPSSSDAAVAIIINLESTASVLLIKRVEREGDPWSGQIAFPGGHRSNADRTLLDTAIRESREEVGIDLRQHQFLGMLPTVPTHTRRMEVTPFVFQLTREVQLNPNDEVAQPFWAPLSQLIEISPTESEVEADGKRLSVASYIYHGHIIWGLTLRILNLLLDK
jgi:8-oxo-dGTP pyrophosphatase MutT (NUDIX family)